MAIINGLGPRTLHMEQHGQVFRILDQNNVIYCETKDENVAKEIVESRNNGHKRENRYVEIQRPVRTVYIVDSATQSEAIAKAMYQYEEAKRLNRVQWRYCDEDEVSYRLVQEHEYESYRRWRDARRY